MPKPQAFGFLTSLRSHVSDLILVIWPKLKILDYLNWKDLSVCRFLLFELFFDVFKKLACLIKFGHFYLHILTVLIKWIFPLVWIVSAQELIKLIDHPVDDVLMSLPVFNINFWVTTGKTSNPDLSFESLWRVIVYHFFFFLGRGTSQMYF